MRIKYTHIALAIIILFSAFLVYDASTYYVSPYLEVSEVCGNEKYLGKPVQVIGVVSEDPIHVGKGGELTFKITDGEEEVTVMYEGPPPQNLKSNIKVVVVGKLTEPSVLKASEVLVKCPSKYEGGSASALNDPVFLLAILIGVSSLVYFIVAIKTKKI